MRKSEKKTPLLEGSLDDFIKHYSNRWIAIEVIEITPEVGITKGRLIASEPKNTKNAVMKEIAKFRKNNPGKKFGLFYTGPFIKPGQDIIIATR